MEAVVPQDVPENMLNPRFSVGPRGDDGTGIDTLGVSGITSP